MSRSLIALSVTVLLQLHAHAQASTAPVPGWCEEIKALTNDPSVASAHWGISVRTLAGEPLCSLNEAQLFRPASNTKLFTTAAALALLGPDKTFETKVLGTLDPATGVVRGDLTLLGGGDANLDSNDLPYVPPAARSKTPAPFAFHDLEDLAAQLVARGVKSITGDIVGDDSAFDWQPYPLTWAIDDLLYGYGAPTSALSIHDNQIDFSVSSRAATTQGSATATITYSPSVPYYTLETNVRSANFAGVCDDRLNFERAGGSKTLHIVGEAPVATKPCTEAIAITDPAEYAALALKLELERRGIPIAGQARAHHAGAMGSGTVFTSLPDHDPAMQQLFDEHGARRKECAPGRVQLPVTHAFATPSTVLATHFSAALRNDLLFTNKVSQNLHAELLLRNTGAAFTCDPSLRSSLHLLREYVLHAGVRAEDFLLYDGSGVSSHNLVAPRALTQLLVYAAAQPWFGTFKSSLPIGGVDGSLAARFTTPALKGNVFAKTGSLGESRALSGYLVTASGETLVFSILDDNHLPSGSADRTIMDRIVERIASQN